MAGVSNYLGYFHEPWNLLWLLALIPLIIFYLIKSRPKKLNLPTTKFLFKDGKSKNFRAFFQKFQTDPVMWLQLLGLLLAILALGIPHFVIQKDLTAGHTVFVVDNSASMEANGGFDKVIEKVRATLASENTIITVSPHPRVLAKKVNAAEAEKILDGIRISHAGSYYKDAISVASNIIEDKENSKIIVIGDLIDSTFEIDYELLVQSLASKGIFMDLVRIGGAGENVGFVDAVFGEEKTTLFIKNYDKKKKITVDVKGTKYPLEVERNSIKTLIYDNLKGDHIVSIIEPDDFMLDNKLFISGQKVDQINILYVTNNPSDSLIRALEVNKAVTVQVTQPPIFPEINHDVIIVDDVDTTLFYDQRITEIRRAVESGKSLIIMPNEKMFDTDWQGMWDASLMNITDDVELVSPASPVKFISSTEFGNIRNPYVIKHSNGSLILAGTPSTSIITMDKYGKGNVLYYGMRDNFTEFKYTYHYPIFFKNLVNFLTGKESLDNLNFKAGSRLPYKGDVTINTATGPVTVSDPQFDQVGFYTVNGKTIAVNLLNEKESDIETRIDYVVSEGSNTRLEFTGDVDTNFYWWFVVVFASLLIFELLIIKFRGDL